MTSKANVTIEAALREASERYTAANPTSRAMNQRAAAVMPGGNTRTILHFDPFPLVFAKGEGARLTDVDGHAYADFLGEYTAGLYGHSHPVIKAAIAEGLEAGIALGGPNRVEAKLAEAMCARFPALEHVRFTNSGTEANLMALVTARAHTGRSAIMAFDGCYHGGVFNFGAPTPINAPFEWELGVYNDVGDSAARIRKLGSRLAAVIVEPLTGAGGCIAGTPAFLAELRKATEEVGALLIFDEVMTSRLTPKGLHGALGITPDLVTFGKYLGGGLSFGAFGGRADIMEHYNPHKPGAWPHAGTFNNNILSMSAGLAGLTQVYTPEAAEALSARGDAFRERLNAIAREAGVPMQVTGRGSMMAVHFLAGELKGPQDARRADKRLNDLFHLDMLAAGQYLSRRGMMALSLPLGDAEFDGYAAAFEEFIASRRELLGPARAAAAE